MTYSTLKKIVWILYAVTLILFVWASYLESFLLYGNPTDSSSNPNAVIVIPVILAIIYSGYLYVVNLMFLNKENNTVKFGGFALGLPIMIITLIADIGTIFHIMNIMEKLSG